MCGACIYICVPDLSPDLSNKFHIFRWFLWFREFHSTTAPNEHENKYENVREKKGQTKAMI